MDTSDMVLFLPLEDAEGSVRMRMRRESRGRWEILRDILLAMKREMANEGTVKKTRVMQKAHLDWRTFQKHFNFLLEQGFIACITDESAEERYLITERGEDLLRKLEDVRRILEVSTERVGARL